jgi:antitoxin (DNA-binding transcriptional repressor) of toxin-antitoxin stability system
MLQIFREIEKKGEEIVVTDNNRPVLRVLPIKKKVPVDTLFAPYRGKVVYHQDIDASTEDEWDEL